MQAPAIGAVRNPNIGFTKALKRKKGILFQGGIGWHYQGNPVPELPGFKVLASCIPPVNGPKTEPHAATLYDGPKGDVVFNAGSTTWAQGLSSPPGHVLLVDSNAKDANRIEDPAPRVQRITANVLDRFIK